jgi:NAD-dependent DNA ligase
MIKKVLSELSIEYIEDIIDGNIELSMDLFDFLLSSEEISTENKIILLTTHMSKVSRLECENYMKIIDSKEHIKIFSGRPNLEINEINKKLLEKFKSKHWISNFYEENGVFKISRRNLKNNLNTALF